MIPNGKIVLSSSKKTIYINKKNCLNCLHSVRTKNKLEMYVMYVCKNKDFCVVMPSKDTNILGFNQYQKSDEKPSIIYADLASLIKRTDGSKNNFEKLFTKK